MPDNDIKNEEPLVEGGVTGLKIASGYVFDEFQKELQGHKGRLKYREMADSDATIGALLMAIEMLLSSVNITVTPSENDTENRFSDFLEEELDYIDPGVKQLIPEILSFLTFGFSILEIVHRVRPDGLTGLAKLAPRSQETILQWVMDEKGKLNGLIQMPPMGGGNIEIPAEKFLHFMTAQKKGNPEGRSVLRNAYKNYHFIKNIQMIEAIGIERDLNGLPVMHVPAKVLGDAQKKESYLQIVRDVKFNEQGGLLLPSEPWPDENGKPGTMRQYELSLLSSEGTRAIDTDKVIRRHQTDMVRSVLAEFLMLGTDKGSFALSKSKTDLFLTAIKGHMDRIMEVLNKRIVGNLWVLNGFPDDMKPEITYDRIAPVDLQELGDFVSKVSGAGIMLTDLETENTLRDAAGFPENTGENMGEGLPDLPDGENIDGDQ